MPRPNFGTVDTEVNELVKLLTPALSGSEFSAATRRVLQERGVFTEILLLSPLMPMPSKRICPLLNSQLLCLLFIFELVLLKPTVPSCTS